MGSFEHVLKNGRVALDNGWVFCDIGIDDGRIAAIGSSLGGNVVTDAAGHWVLPGGIETHCHLNQPDYGTAKCADDFRSGSISAAFGGNTFMIPFAMPATGMSTLAALERVLPLAARQSIIDYSFHAVANARICTDIDVIFDTLLDWGVTSVKLFTTYDDLAADDDTLLTVMAHARARGMTVMLHAENDAVIRRVTRRLTERGHTAMRYLTVAHSAVAEREATHRAIALAEIAGARIMIVHLSGQQSATEVLRGKQRGVAVLGETCPQYLFLSAADVDQKPEQAARYVFAPPAREVADQDYLWQALADGTIDVFSSDHSPSRLCDKVPDPASPSFTNAVAGIPGIETRLPLLFSEGLLTGRLTLARYLDLSCRNAARIYGVEHRKGHIAVGYDADLALWDPDCEYTLRHAELHSNVDYTPFEGRRLRGRPRTVILRGQTIVANGLLENPLAQGVFVARAARSTEDFPPAIEDRP